LLNASAKSTGLLSIAKPSKSLTSDIKSSLSGLCNIYKINFRPSFP
jgi:hypothetical protein